MYVYVNVQYTCMCSCIPMYYIGIHVHIHVYVHVYTCTHTTLIKELILIIVIHNFSNRRLMLTDRDDLELSVPQPKRPRKTLMDALTSPDSPPPLYTVQSVSRWMDG